MAAAQLTVRFLGRSGRIYSINGYASDASNVLVKFDESKVAVSGSPDYYVLKENASLIDVCFTTDTATPTSVQTLRQGSPTGDILDITAHLASVVNRPNPNIGFNAGEKFSLMQL